MSIEEDYLRKENALLREQCNLLNSELQRLSHACVVSKGQGLMASEVSKSESKADSPKCLSIVVLGASGDLAFKKTYPALFSLYHHGLMPEKFLIAGYARSAMADDVFKSKVSSKFDKNLKDKASVFLNQCFYFAGQYDNPQDFARFSAALDEKERALCGPNVSSERIFYFAIPPNIFVPVAKSISAAALSKTGYNRVIVEKPFGRDLQSSDELQKDLGALFSEDQIYRIDHYLGKEMVQNLMVLRFANKVFEPLWNKENISCVQITFKEDFGTQGRGGYFDSFGIIRDVMQNHLLQILSLVAMEAPVSLNAEDVRDEKVKLLRAIAPIRKEDIIIGQYLADPKGRESGYLEDPTVPKDSVTPTYACAVLHVNNSRWAGTPFILKCGKALNERKAEIRVQFKSPQNFLFAEHSHNELVMRVQPDEAVYLKMTTKQPGLQGGLRHTELDLSYKKRFKDEAEALPDAYERLILDVIRGDHNLFVRADELVYAWKIFTPILHYLEKEKTKPELYEFGSRGPKSADAFVAKLGYVRTTQYEWAPQD